MAQTVEQAQIVSQSTINPLQSVTQLALFDENGDSLDVGGSSPAAATTTTAGVVKQAEAQADSTATDAAGVVSDFNDLLAKLRTAGLLDS